MTEDQAEAIAHLLNTQNQLVSNYDAKKILSAGGQFLYRSGSKDPIIACVELKKVQWYQFEVCHLTVHPDYKRQGHGKSLIEEAEQRAVAAGARVLQCTIRDGNCSSEQLFANSGFARTSRFYYPTSKNHVTVWQKVVSFAP